MVSGLRKSGMSFAFVMQLSAVFAYPFTLYILKIL